MRLTLRNMLAYIDGLLEPEDAEQMKAMIDESEYATELMIRIRDVVRRLRLGAPPVDGPEAVLQPNTVADYLDNVLPAEQVPDFERVCLESDQLLAEVAACHQVLALVLGEPAHVDPETRQRLYQLPNQLEREVVANEPPQVIVPAAALAGFAATEPDLATGDPPVVEPPGNRRRPEVPEYLRESEAAPPRRFGWLIPAAAFVLLLIGGAGILLYSTGRLTVASRTPAPLADNVPLEDAPLTAEDAEAEDAATEAAAAAEAALEETADELAPVDAGGAPEAPAIVGEIDPAAVDTPTAPRTASTEGAENAGGDAETPNTMMRPAATPTTTVDPPAPGEVGPEDAALGETPVMTNGRPSGLAVPGAVARPDAAPTTDAAEQPGGGAAVPPLPSEGPLVADGGEATVPDAAEQQLGRLVTDRTVLLRFNQQQIGWELVPTRQTILPGDQLLALPTFRSMITLNNGVNLDIRGGTAVQLGVAPPSGMLSLLVDFGRVELITTSGRGTQMRLATVDESGTLSLEDPDSIVAIEVTPRVTPGTNPEQAVARRGLDIYVVSGSASWESTAEANELVTAAAGEVIRVAGTAAVGLAAQPEWVRGETVPPIDRKAAEAIRDYLTPQRPVPLALKELADHRLTEIRALAVRCLAYLGEYESLVRALNDSAQHAYWQAQVGVLQDSVSRSTADAARVREALERLHPNTAAQLYRLLWGYNANQLEQGGAAQLVEWLDSPSQETRILAFANLYDLTGATLSYRPDQPEARRQSSLQRWRGKLNSGEITARAAQQPPPTTTPAASNPTTPNGGDGDMVLP